mmetsp:Transcript_86932/g.246354  ORF Transcript_86932/g.246354 Transcript_86932/m.246354 type:complete len:274 (-) Transcript_86932:623-1444(-)
MPTPTPSWVPFSTPPHPRTLAPSFTPSFTPSLPPSRSPSRLPSPQYCLCGGPLRESSPELIPLCTATLAFTKIAYNEFMEQIEPFAAIKPVMVLPGNHEAECHSPNCQLSSTKVHQLSNFSAYVHRFRMPYDESGATSNMWYSFDVPPIHFVNIDTETDYKNAPNDSYTPFTSNGNFANGGSWTEWLEADLDKVDRSHTPFVFGEAGDVQPQRPDACATCDQWPTTLPFPPISLRISRRPPPDLLGDLLRQQRQPRRRLRQPAGRDRGYYVFA